MKFKLIFAWYDLWVGVFVDHDKKCIYVFPVPCIGLRIYRERAMLKALQRAVDEPRFFDDWDRQS